MLALKCILSYCWLEGAKIMFIESLKSEESSTAGKSSETSRLKWSEDDYDDDGKERLWEGIFLDLYIVKMPICHIESTQFSLTEASTIERAMIAISLEKYVFWRRQQRASILIYHRNKLFEIIASCGMTWLLQNSRFQIPEDSLGSWSRSRNRLTMYSNPEGRSVDWI
jgi:hypothetical protein